MSDEVIKEKKKQKAPLGIRPDDYIESKFKSMAEEKGVSQTRLFESMFWEFTRKASESLKLEALDCSLELQSISGASSTLIKAIEKIVAKAQLEIMAKNREFEAIKESSDKRIELANIELTNKIKELELKNKDLETKINLSNESIIEFEVEKNHLNKKIENLEKSIKDKEEIINDLNKELIEKDKIISDKEKEIINKAKTIKNTEKEINLMKEQTVLLKGKNESLQVNMEMLQGTLNSFNLIKKTEIEAIKENEATINQLKIDKIKVEYDNEMFKLNNNISTLKSSIELKDVEIESLKKSIDTIMYSKE